MIALAVEIFLALMAAGAVALGLAALFLGVMLLTTLLDRKS